MKPAKIIILSVLILAFQASSKPTTVLVKETIRATVTIKCFDKEKNEVGVGSGFILSPDGYVVTNWHVIESCKSLAIVLFNGAKFNSTSLSTYNREIDIAVIKIEGSNLDTLRIAKKNPLLGSKVVVIGSPFGLEKSVSEGILSGFRKKNEYDILQITAPISSGSSGGPVIDSYGNVVGIVKSYIKNSQQINFVIHFKYILEVYDRDAPLIDLDDIEDKGEEPVLPQKALYPKMDLSGVYSVTQKANCNLKNEMTGILILSSSRNGLMVLSSNLEDRNDRHVFQLAKALASKDGAVLLDFGLPFDGYQTDNGFFTYTKLNNGESSECTYGILSGETTSFKLSDPHGAYEIKVRTNYISSSGYESTDMTGWYGNAAVVFAKDSIFISIELTNASGGGVAGMLKGYNLKHFKVKTKSGDLVLEGFIQNGELIGTWYDIRRDRSYFKGILNGNRK